MFKFQIEQAHQRCVRVCIFGENVTRYWKIVYISTIHKKGRKDESRNCRVISVTSNLVRLQKHVTKSSLVWQKKSEKVTD